jgi:hypothetical protein
MNYTCYRGTVDIDGDLDKAAWASAPQTPRFAESGKLAFLDTRAALLWDDDCLYAAFWLEERDVWSRGEQRQGMQWQDNAAGLCIACKGAYYTLAVMPTGRRDEMFYIWKDAYARGGRYDVADFNLADQKPAVLGGDGGPHHWRGMRWAFFDWTSPGLETAVQIDGTLDQRHEIDRGWRVEMALPWAGLAHLADGPLPPQDGDVWRIGLLRHQLVDQRLQCFATTWTPYPMGEGVHVPEDYSTVAFAASEADQWMSCSQPSSR